MRKAVTIALAAAGLTAALAIGRTLAQDRPAPGGPEAAGFTQLFISPAGEPYRAKRGEPYPVVVWFKQADTNHDGAITKEEFRADHAGFFYALDNDDAGYLDGPKIAFYERRLLPDVYLASLGALEPRRAPAGPARTLPAMDVAGGDEARLIRVQGANILGGNPNANLNGGLGAQGPMEGLGARRAPKKRMEAAAFYGLLGEPEPVRGADTNLDGRVTKEEFLAAADRRFKELDKRHDGRLTLDELPPTPAQLALARNSR
ncbi:MAG: EF-hand domain-containing protein [Proteobacteria bacterium]|nr:EF-hand domain-containing protein [Pseudomonadota bacterium]